MSTHQQSKPRAANQSITELSGRPGTCRSKVGCDAMDEPCTNRILLAGPEGSPAYFSNRNRRTSPFWAQCSSPRTVPEGVTGLFMLGLPNLLGPHGRFLRARTISEIAVLTNDRGKAAGRSLVSHRRSAVQVHSTSPISIVNIV